MRPRQPVVMLAVGQTLAWAGLYYIFPALLLRWEQQMGWSRADITAAILLAVLVSAVLSPLAGRIIDAGRGPHLMAGSAVLGGVGMMALSQVGALWQFYALWSLIGAGMAGCLYEPCFAIVTRARSREAKSAIILITLVAGFASTLAFPIVHTLAEALGWRATVRLSGVMVVLVVAPILWRGAAGLEREYRVTAGPDAADGPRKKRPREAFMRLPAFWFLALGFSFVAVAHGATLHHFLAYLDERGLSPETAVLAASFIGPMQVAGRLAMMASEKYTSHHGVAIAAFGLLGLAIALLLFGHAAPASLSGFVILFGGAYGTVSILRPLLTRDILGERDFGAKSGAVALPFLVGSASAPYLGSVIWGIGGYGLMFSTLIALLLLGCLLYLVAHRLARR